MPPSFPHQATLWLSAVRQQRYHQSFTWAGVSIQQLPDDVVRLQQLIHQEQPDVIVEVGVASGGCSLFFATLCQMMQRGRVVAVDKTIPKIFQHHSLARYITGIAGDSVASVTAVRAAILPHEKVLVMLDSNHKAAHVTAELNAYAPLVQAGGYLLVADTHLETPMPAIADFLAANQEFQSLPTPNSGASHFHGGWLRRK